MQLGVSDLWARYTSKRDVESREKLMEAYRGLVKYVSGKFCRNARTRLDTIEEGDIMQFGMLGLLDAIERFDTSRGVRFETYAVARITGTIQDELRKLDWVPRSIRQKAREAERVIQQTVVAPAPGRLTKKEAAAQTAALKKYQELMDETQGSVMERLSQHEGDDLNFEKVVIDDNEDPVESLLHKEALAVMAQAIKNLPERERLVVTLYYYEELTFKEIAKVLGLSESRVFQIHSFTLRKLKGELAEII